MGYFTEGPENVQYKPLLHLFGVDNLSTQNNPVPGGDGVFDFIDQAATRGGTVNSSNGRIYFPVLEPFGSHIRNKIFPNDPDLANKYAFDSLYTTTKTTAEQYSEKNKFTISGFYSSQSGSEISLNAMNVAQGSVNVTAGGVQLVENVDYTVDYTLGRVTIINEGILNSGTPINISLESNSGFSALRKTFLGTRIEHEFNPDFRVGGTILYLGEKSYTQKFQYGEEAIANTIYGGDISYHTDARWLTNFINKIPGISTKAPSRINVDGEFARFIPGLSRSASERGTSYIDDFEGAKSTIDLRLPMAWKLASTPQNQHDMFPEAAGGTGLAYGKTVQNWLGTPLIIPYSTIPTTLTDPITLTKTNCRKTLCVRCLKLKSSQPKTLRQAHRPMSQSSTLPTIQRNGDLTTTMSFPHLIRRVSMKTAI